MKNEDIIEANILRSIFLLGFYEWIREKHTNWDTGSYVYLYQRDTSEVDFQILVDEYESGIRKFTNVNIVICICQDYDFGATRDFLREYFMIRINYEPVNSVSSLFDCKYQLNHALYYTEDVDIIPAEAYDEYVLMQQRIQKLGGSFFITNYSKSHKWRYEDSLFESIFESVESFFIEMMRFSIIGQEWVFFKGKRPLPPIV